MLKVLIILLIIAAVIAFLVARRAKKVGADKARLTEPEEPSIEEIIAPHNQALVELNLSIRNDADRDDGVVSKMEIIIDLIVKLLPEVNSRFPMEKTTYLVNQAALKYLADLIEPYMKLDKADRADKRADLMTTLDAIETDLKKIEDIIRRADLTTFKIEGLFLAKRFGASRPAPEAGDRTGSSGKGNDSKS
jgi:hypothetical protein